MIRSIFISTVFLILTKGQNLNENVRNCTCVYRRDCTASFGENIITKRNFLDNQECDTGFKTCCPNGSIKNGGNIAPVRGREECGFRNKNGIDITLIETDLESQFGEFPWMVEILAEIKSVFRNKVLKYFAGGSLIHTRIVITAAHKVYDQNPDKLKVRAGEWDKGCELEPLPHHDRKVDQILVHEDFNYGTVANGIALLVLNFPLNTAANIQTVCVPPQNFGFNDFTRCFVTGWGADAREGNKTVNILKKIDVPLVPHRRCESLYRQPQNLGNTFQLHENFICAGGEEGRDSCDGDGGSPLVCPIPNTDEQYYLAGIVLWGIGCAVENIPGVYIEVSKYHNWINEKMRALNLQGV